MYRFCFVLLSLVSTGSLMREGEREREREKKKEKEQER